MSQPKPPPEALPVQPTERLSSASSHRCRSAVVMFTASAELRVDLVRRPQDRDWGHDPLK